QMLLPSLLLSLLPIISSIEIGEDLKVDLQLVKHQACPHNAKSKWSRKIEFEGGNGEKGPRLEEVEGRKGCYSIGGRVNVLQEFSGNFSIFLEIRRSASTLPERCVKQGTDGCGGVGSCLYCDACSSFGSNIGVHAQLLLNEKSIECADGLRPGSYDDLKLQFCLPNIDEILESQGLTKKTLLSLIQSEDGRSLGSMSLFATVFIFDVDVRRQMAAQSRIEKIYREENNKKSLFKDEALPSEVYWSMPFNSLIKKQYLYIGCHKIYGNVQIRT
ncbi:hypothetical protein PFISCL1PPCAC_24731, partial [Pristionchus fissidentatus]